MLKQITRKLDFLSWLNKQKDNLNWAIFSTTQGMWYKYYNIHVYLAKKFLQLCISTRPYSESLVWDMRYTKGWFEEHEDRIEKARQKGRFVYDMPFPGILSHRIRKASRPKFGLYIDVNELVVYLDKLKP